MASHESGRQRGRSERSTRAALPALCKQQIWGKDTEKGFSAISAFVRSRDLSRNVEDEILQALEGFFGSLS